VDGSQPAPDLPSGQIGPCQSSVSDASGNAAPDRRIRCEPRREMNVLESVVGVSGGFATPLAEFAKPELLSAYIDQYGIVHLEATEILRERFPGQVEMYLEERSCEKWR
jgi:hypothetical protein